jgi:hypothetical protein
MDWRFGSVTFMQQKRIDHNEGAKQSNEKCVNKSNKKQGVSTH